MSNNVKKRRIVIPSTSSSVSSTESSTESNNLQKISSQKKTNNRELISSSSCSAKSEEIYQLEKEVTAEEVNAAIQKRAEQIPTILQLETRPLVSKDFQKDSHSSIVDAMSTMVMGGNMVKILSWYDNEWGYSSRMVDLAEFIANK